jgi:hypothetical protein
MLSNGQSPFVVCIYFKQFWCNKNEGMNQSPTLALNELSLVSGNNIYSGSAFRQTGNIHSRVTTVLVGYIGTDSS